MFRPSFCRSLCLVLVTFPLVACLDQPYDPDGPGEFVGVFTVDADQETNTCGAGALNAPPAWSFDVRLSREIGAVYWNNGAELITGTLDADKHSFTFDTTVIFNMRDANSAPWLEPCSVKRHDVSSGKIAEDDATFSGKLSYDFFPAAGSECSDLLMSDPPVFTALPCSMTYKLEAKRTSTTP